MSASCRSAMTVLPLASSLASAAAIRSRISAAAALVNVTTSISVISMGCLASRRRRIIRSTKTAVLPEPAAADKSRVCWRLSMAACCSLVQAMFFISFLLNACNELIGTEIRHEFIAIVMRMRIKGTDGMIRTVGTTALILQQ